MTKVPLRAYLAEIQEAIEQKQTEEAVAHCRHILQTYPKHIETYRLLGKAYLESQRYGNAADIFQRVLSSIPDDFVSHVGMSIIREDETNLDEAIWHMKRAYESQPYNTAIQSELRRLYGRRDGTEPQKIRLTRGALARMYIKGNLYEQAIAELRTALVKDPQRTDLQVFLAVSYAQSGKRNEAIETCSALLQRLPYCLEANRLLASLMPDTGNAEEMQICRQRIQAMDPYEAFISPQAPTADDVPSQAVTLYRLEWDGGPAVPQTSAQPEWATSIGVSMSDSNSDEEGLPDWLASSPEDESVFDRGSAESSSEEGGDAIPDWMQEVGWGPSTGEFDESKSAFPFDREEGVSEEAVAADIPDWLQGMAPDDDLEAEDESVTTPESLAPELPDWLDEEADGASETIIAWLDNKDQTEVSEETIISGLDEPSEEVPEWLQDLGVAAGTAGVTAAASTLIPDSSGDAEEEVPDWLKEMVSEESASQLIDDELEVPDWLQGIEEDEAPAEEAEPVAEAAEIPDWLQGLGEVETPAKEIETFAEEEPEAEAAEIPDWLQGLGEVETPVEEIEPVAEEELDAEAAEIPDWLQGLGEVEAPAKEIETFAEKELDAEATEIPDWLQGLGEVETLAEEIEPVTEEEPEAEAAEIPDWLQGLGEVETPAEELEPVAEEELEAEAAEIPDWLQEFGAIETPVEEIEPVTEEELEAEAAEIPDWLQGFGEVEAPAEELELVAEEELEAEAAEIPDWLQGLGEVEAPTGEIEPVAEEELEAEDVDIPDWLQGLGGDDVPIAEPTGVTSWLKSINDEEIPIEDLETPTEEVHEAEATEIPEWLQEFGEVKTPAEELGPVAGEELEAEAAEIPDWLQEFGEVETPVEEIEPVAGEELEAEAAEIPDWLQGMSEDLPPTVEVRLPTQDESDELEIPDWFQEFSEDEAPISDAEPVAADDTSQEIKEIIGDHDLPPEVVDEFDAAMAWLEGLAAKQGVSEEELLSSPEERSETPPEWIQNASAEASEVEDEFPEWLAEIGVDEAGIPEPATESRGTGDLIDASAAIAWLESLDLSEDHEAEEPVDSEEAEFPEWQAEPEPVDEVETIESPEGEKWDTTPDQDIDDKDETPISWETEDRFSKKVETEFQFEDSDSAMAWLEGLAAKQGVSEEELLSSPEDRSETPPDWVQNMAKDKSSAAVTAPLDQIENIEPDFDLPDESAYLTDETIEDQLKQEPEVDISPTELIEEPFGELFQSLEEEAPVPEEETSEFDFDDADAAMAWLEGLAAKQGVDENELLSSPEQRPETPPEWVQGLAEEAETQVELLVEDEAETEIEQLEGTETQEMPAWLKDSIAAADVVGEVGIEEEPVPEPDLDSIPEDIPNWLRDTILGEAVSVKDSVLEVEPEKSQPEVVEPPTEFVFEEAAQGPVPGSPLVETEPPTTESEVPLETEISPDDVIKPPSWVTDEEAPDDDEYTWLTPDVIDEFAETSDALLNINQASLIQLERLPGMGFIRAQAVINYRDEHGEFNKLEDLLNVPEFDAETLGAIRNYVMVAVTTPKKPASKPGTGPLIMPITTEKPEDQYHAQQIEAQIKLAEGDIDGALAQYGRLIKKGKRLEGIIEDLNQALYQVPMDVSVNVLQTLGDAYMRAGQLQDALDMYTKAEELLR